MINPRFEAKFSGEGANRQLTIDLHVFGGDHIGGTLRLSGENEADSDALGCFLNTLLAKANPQDYAAIGAQLAKASA